MGRISTPRYVALPTNKQSNKPPTVPAPPPTDPAILHFHILRFIQSGSPDVFTPEVARCKRFASPGCP